MTSLLDLGTGRGDRLCYPQFESDPDGTIGTGCGIDEDCELEPANNGWQVWFNPACGCDTYRLPTNAEWEVAARAGTRDAAWPTESDQTLEHAAWYAANSDEHVHETGQTQPNGFGLYDVIGNVAEWVMEVIPREDQWSFPSNNTAIRGGSFADPVQRREFREPSRLRSSSRFIVPNLRRDATIGVRLVRTIYPPGTVHCLCKTTCPIAHDCRGGSCVSTVGEECEAHYQCGNDGRCVDGRCTIEQ